MSAQWKQRPEGGGRFALWLIRSIARHGGRALARACLYPITLYFLIVRGPERRASRAYLARVLPREPTTWDVARHIHTFAATILDRVFLLGGELTRFDIRTPAGEFREISWASSTAAANSSSVGTTRLTRPIRSASSAPTIRAV